MTTTTTDTTQLAQAGFVLATQSTEVSVLKLYGVATAFYLGTMTYDPNGSNGKGRFSGGAEVVRIMTDGAAEHGYELPEEYKGQVSKIARVLVDYARDLLDLATPDIRLEGCRQFVRNFGCPLALYNSGRESKGGTSLAQMVANLLAWASKKEIDLADVVAEVVTQAGGHVEGEVSE